MNDSELGENLMQAQSSLPDLGLLVLAIFMLMVLIFSLLMVKQSSHMVKVLPTPLSPYIRTTAICYTLYSVLTLGLIIINLL